jgi:hypothetical protein
MAQKKKKNLLWVLVVLLITNSQAFGSDFKGGLATQTIDSGKVSKDLSKDGLEAVSKDEMSDVEISLEAFAVPFEGSISVFYGIFDASGKLWKRCGSLPSSSSEAPSACYVTFTLGHRKTQALPLMPDKGIHTDEDGEENMVWSLARNERLYFGKLAWKWHTLTMTLMDAHMQAFVQRTVAFEWVQPSMLPHEAMESAIQKLSERPSSENSTHGRSWVRTLPWSGFECSMPRATMRAFRLQNVQVTAPCPRRKSQCPWFSTHTAIWSMRRSHAVDPCDSFCICIFSCVDGEHPVFTFADFARPQCNELVSLGEGKGRSLKATFSLIFKHLPVYCCFC